MRTLVISDLHLGSRRRRDVLALATVRAPLIATASECDRVVLLGDVFDLVDVEFDEALDVAAPLLQSLGAAVGKSGQIVLVGGNHDRPLYVRFIDRAGDKLGLAEWIEPPGDPSFAAIARLVAPAELAVAYPGVWLRDDVYATHGHYVDRHITLPGAIDEAIPGALRGTLRGRRDPSTPGDYERALAPAYAAYRAFRGTTVPWLADALAARSGVAPMLAGVATPLVEVAAALPGPGLAPLGATALGLQLRRAGLRGMTQVIRRLEIDAAHVIFGHIHHAGPLDSEELDDWVAPSGAAMHNAGCWVYEPVLLAGAGPESPYWPGACLIVEEEGPPRLEQLLADFSADELRR